MFFSIKASELSADMLEANGIAHLSPNADLEVEILPNGNYDIELCHKITIGTGLLLDRKVVAMKFRIDEWNAAGDSSKTYFARTPREAFSHVTGMRKVSISEGEGWPHTSIQPFLGEYADMDGWNAGDISKTSPQYWV